MIDQFIYGLHPVTLTILVLTATVGTAVCLVLLNKHFIRFINPKALDFKIETYSDAFGVATSILLSLIIVSEWTSYNQVDQSMHNELYALNDLYELSENFNNHTTTDIRTNLRTYVETVIKEEWPLLSQGKSNPHVERYLLNNFKLLHKNKIEDTNQEQLHIAFQNTLERIIENRRTRLFNAEATLSPIMWFVVISCIFISFFILSLATRGPPRLSLLLQGLFSLGIGLLLLLIVILNKPFYYGIHYDGAMSAKALENLLEAWDRAEQ